MKIDLLQHGSALSLEIRILWIAVHQITEIGRGILPEFAPYIPLPSGCEEKYSRDCVEMRRHRSSEVQSLETASGYAVALGCL